MKRWMIGIGLGVVLAVAGYFAWMMFAPPPSDLDTARSKTSAAGLYSVAIEPEAEPFDRNRIHSWIVSVATPQGEAVTDAQLSVDGGMPQHGHGLPTQPRITDHLGEGRYRLEGVRFNMAGWWVLRFSIDSPRGSDTVEFNLTL